MKRISFRCPTSIKDIKVLWKEYTSKRYRKNVEAMRKMADFYINNTLDGRWQEITTGGIARWTDGDKRQFKLEMRYKCEEYISKLMV